MSLSCGIHKLLLTICPFYICNLNSKSRYIKKRVKPWHGRSYFFSTPSFLLVWIALSIINTSSACPFDILVGRMNPGMSGVALRYRCSRRSISSMLLSCCISYSTSAPQLSLLSFGLSKSTFQWSQSSVSEMLAGALSWSLSTGWRLILQIQRALNTWVCPPWRSFADKASGKGDVSDNLNTAARTGCNSVHDDLTISSLSEMYPTAVIGLFWARDFILGKK